MKEFLLIFRRNVNSPDTPPSPEQMEQMMQKWQNWIGGIAAQNKMVSAGNRLSAEGKVVKNGGIVTDGPYVELTEAVGGYTIIKAESLEEAAELSKDCPIFLMGGNVEVRAIIGM